MKIDNILLDNLTAQAQASPRLRMNLDLRTQATEMPGQAGHDMWCDTSQRMLNAIEPGSVVPVHRHQKTTETMVVLRGRVVEEYYSPDGSVEESVEVAACGPVCALNIPAGRWHSLRALESGTVILEMKDGAYEPVREEDVLK